jgi:hypothetical protein
MELEVFQFDSCSAWVSTVRMLETICYAEPALLAYAAAYGYPSALVEGDFTLARHAVGALRPLSDATMSMQAHSASSSQVLPQLYALKDEYSMDAPIFVPEKLSVHEVVKVEAADAHADARALRAAIADDISVNERHVQNSRDTLLKSTAVDPRFRLRSLSRWLDVAERERVKDMVVEEVVAAMAISPGPQGQCVPQIHANAGNATERAQKRLRALLEPTELAAQLALEAAPTVKTPLLFWMVTFPWTLGFPTSRPIPWTFTGMLASLGRPRVWRSSY